MLAVVLRMAASGGHNFDLLCPTILTICYFVLVLLGCASFLNVTSIAVDRLLAISLHLRYRELVALMRVIIALVSIWITSRVAASLYLVNSRTVIVVVTGEFVGILLTTLAHLQSCKTSSESNPQSTSTAKCASNGTIPGEKVHLQCCVFVRKFFACYLPHFSSLILFITHISNFCLVGFARYNLLRSSQFVVKPSRLLLAISRNSSTV